MERFISILKDGTNTLSREIANRKKINLLKTKITNVGVRIRPLPPKLSLQDSRGKAASHR